MDGKDLYLEFSGNLVPVTKSGQQLKFTFKAFRQNRLTFHVKVKDSQLDPVARMMFMRDLKVAKGDPPQQPICVLNIVLPEVSLPKSESTTKIKGIIIIIINKNTIENKKQIFYHQHFGMMQTYILLYYSSHAIN